MAKQFDVIVAGVGAMGAAVCWELARRGVSVLGLDRFGIPNTKASHHGRSRALRLAYFEHTDYVPLLRRAYEHWRDLDDRAGGGIVHRTGGLWMGPEHCELVAGSLAAAQEHGLPFEWLETAQLRERFVQFTMPEDFVAFFESDAGLVPPERAIQTYASLIRQLGGVLTEEEPVESWSAEDGGVRVTTARDTYHAGHLVLCAGAWSERLLGDIGIRLTVTRQPLMWVDTEDPESFGLERCPVWSIDRPAGGMYYGFPIMGDRPGFKVGIHDLGEATNPDTVDRQWRGEDEHELREMLARFIPKANGDLLNACVCLYTNTPDSHFVIDRHPEHDNVTIACGFSGHGFKFAGVFGEAIADLVLEGATALPIDFLSLQRLAT